MYKRKSMNKVVLTCISALVGLFVKYLNLACLSGRGIGVSVPSRLSANYCCIVAS
jgi:hypothetical protein